MTDPKTGSAPHACPECGEPCYIPFGLPAECTNRECLFYSEDCWVRHVMELPDQTCGEGGEEFDIEDEDTVPFLKLPSLTDLLHGYTAVQKQLDAADTGRAIVDAIDQLDELIDQVPTPFYLTDD